jgi:hypothetical protein
MKVKSRAPRRSFALRHADDLLPGLRFEKSLG